jgi:tetratricopeptide (TPR) repeat protein
MTRPSSSPAKSFSGWLLPLGLLWAVILAVFWRAIFGDFLTWDDEPLIYANPHIAQPTLASLAWQWTHPHFFLFIPLVYTLWWLIAKATLALGAAQLTPVSFHAANLLVHLASTSIVYLLLRRMFKNPWACFAGAAVFAVHPLQVEAVAWATGMKDLLGGCLMLAAIAVYLAAGDEPRKKFKRWAAIALYVAALLAKPSAVMAPVIALVLAVLAQRRAMRTVLLELLPWFLLAAVAAAVARRVQPAAAVSAGPIWARPWIAADALGFYLQKLAVPIHLAIDYGRTPQRVIDDRDLLDAAIAVAIAIVVIRLRKWQLTAALLLFAAALLPVLGFIPFEFQVRSTVADRYVYVAMLAAAMAIAFAANALPRRIAVFLAALIIAGCAVLSFVQVNYWRDSQSLYTHALEVNPQSLTAAQDLAVVYDKSGQEDQAIAYYLKAIAIAPDDREEYDNLALALPRAEQAFPHTPQRWAGLHEQLARYYQSQGLSDLARQQQTAAARLR